MFKHSNPQSKQPQLLAIPVARYADENQPSTLPQDISGAGTDALMPLGESLQSPTKWGFDIIVEAVRAFEEKLRAQPAPRQYDAPTLPDGPLPELPDYIQQPITHRQFIRIPLQKVIEAHTIPLNEARSMMRKKVREFLQNYQPGTLLLVKPKPGVGKTTMAVELAEELARQGKRVLFCGPRHNFFQDILNISIEQNEGKAERWYEWLSRDHKDLEGAHDMCLYSEDINKWMGKGYEGKDFCAGVCGYKYMSKTCAYHQQKHKAGKLVMGQHAHLWTGLPAGDHGEFDVIICDENPMGQMLHKWMIPAKYVMPIGMDKEDPLTELLDDLRKLVLDTGKDGVEKNGFEGIKLLEKLGGVTHVREILESWDIEVGDAKIAPPAIHQAGDAETAPYGHLVDLIPMLLREARLLEAGTPGIPRVIVASGNLMLLKRRQINPKYADLPMIWLDGTAEQHICEAISQRKVIVVEPVAKMKGTIRQVGTDMHGIDSFKVKDENGKAIYANGKPVWNLNKIQRERENIEYVVKTRGYENVGVITYEGIEGFFDDFKTGHFYGERGTNEFEDCDAIFVLGTPQPKMSEILTMAKMIYDERDTPFPKIDKDHIKKTWADRRVPYVGQPTAFPVGGFWDDTDLQAVLQQYREAEIEQAAHRIRPISRACDIWLITPVPIAGLPPIEVLDRHKLRDAPKGVDPDRWEAFMKFADERHAKDEPICATDLIAAERPKPLRMSRPHALEFIDRLCEWQPDLWAIGNARESKAGRPPKVAIPIQNDS